MTPTFVSFQTEFIQGSAQIVHPFGNLSEGYHSYWLVVLFFVPRKIVGGEFRRAFFKHFNQVVRFRVVRIQICFSHCVTPFVEKYFLPGNAPFFSYRYVTEKTGTY